MDLQLNGKNAIIGASSEGLGKACALELAREGCNLVICGRREEVLHAAAKEVEAAGPGKLITVLADLATMEGQNAVLSAAHDNLGTVDILITNTGGPPPGIFESHDPSAWDSAYQLLLASAVAMINGVLPGMKDQNWGRIIAITSMAVKQPANMLILSNTMRAGVTGLCRSLANELGPHNITVNSVLPGFTRTQRLISLFPGDEKFSAVSDQIPMGRVGEPEEFAAMVAFLASQRASYITGTSIPVDGGAIKSLL